MKPFSYEDLKRHKDYLEHQNTLLAFFLFDTIRGVSPDAIETSPESQFEGKLFRVLAPHEGYFVLIPTNPNAGIPGVHFLNDIDDKWPIEIRLLADRLKVARQRLWTEDIVRKS